MYDYDDLLMQYALNNSNYKKWRKEHTKVFGDIFSKAFKDNPEAQIHLTAALVNISGRNFDSALPKLSILETICIDDYDTAVVNYFLGLNYELIGNDDKMNEYYEKLKDSGIDFAYPIAFHPYYRTAKSAQRDSELGRAVYYYRKALSIYDGRPIDDKIKAGTSQIIYDIATINLVMHEYDECERFLALSEVYNPDENQQRNYVKAILRAVQNNFSESYSLAEDVSRFFRENLVPMLDAIKNGTDPHYCICEQDIEKHNKFWQIVSDNKIMLEELLPGKEHEAVKFISDRLTESFAFMKRRLDCRILYDNGKINVYLKTYCVKTLEFEYEALISKKPERFGNWIFTPVRWFEEYNLAE